MEEDFGPWSEFDEKNYLILMRLAWKAVQRLNKRQRYPILYPLKTLNAKQRQGNGTMYEFEALYGEAGFNENSSRHLWRIRAWIEPTPSPRDTIQWMEMIRDVDRGEDIQGYGNRNS